MVKRIKKKETMAFKLRSPLHKENPKFGEVPVAASSKGYAGYQSILKDRLRSTAPKERAGGDGDVGGNQNTGTFPDPQTGEKRYYDKAHQSYSSKTGLVNKTGNFKDGVYNLNKTKPKAKSVMPASQGGSPMAYRGDGKYKSANVNVKAADLLGQGPIAKGFRALTGIDTPKSSFPSKITSTTGGSSNLDFSKGDIIGQYDKGKSKPSKPSNSDDGVMLTNAGTNTKPKNTKPATSTSTNTTKSSKPTTTLSTGSNTNKDKSGGYLKDTKNFSLGVDTKMNTSSMPKFEKTVTNARSADYDMIRAKGRGKIDRLKTRLDKREGRVANRVEASSMRIKSRQQRSGNRYASKMEASANTGTNPGKFESQKKLDAFEKVMDSPKATPRTSGAGNIKVNTTVPKLRTPKSNQTVAKPSMKLNTSTQTSITIDDSKIKKGVMQAEGGRINEKVSKSTYKNAKGLNKLTKKAGPSGGMERGMPKSSTSITKPGSGPRAKTVKVKSGPSKREKAIMNTYNNIRK